MKKIVFFVVIAFLASCASKKERELRALKKKNALKEVNTHLKNSSDVSGGDSVGVVNDKVVVQRKVYLSEVLRKIKNETYSIEYEVYGNREYGTKGLYGVYRDCRIDLNAKNLGGDGKVPPIEESASVLKDDPELTFSKDKNGNLIGVSEEFLTQRIDRYKKFRSILRKRRDEYEKKVRICKTQLKTAKKEARNK